MTASGRYPSNRWGLYDLIGNVWEWTQDCYRESYEGAPTDGTAWQSGDCKLRVTRGGAWGHDPAGLRVADRNRNVAANRGGDRGFRLAEDL